MSTKKNISPSSIIIPKKSIIVFFFINIVFIILFKFIYVLSPTPPPSYSLYIILITYLIILNLVLTTKGVSKIIINQIKIILRIFFPAVFIWDIIKIIDYCSGINFWAGIIAFGVLPFLPTFIIYFYWYKTYHSLFKLNNEEIKTMAFGKKSCFDKKLMELIQTEKVIQINNLAISCNIAPLKAKKIILKKIHDGYIIGRFDEIKWELLIGKDAVQNPPESHQQQDISSQNTIIPPNYSPTTPSTNPLQSSDPQQNVSGLLALLFGDLGVHKFYMGDTTLGIVYFCLSWTFIPGLLGLIEGIMILTESQAAFNTRLMKIRNK
ncbi:TM2 domain-containing protein [Promethearchaeum syntrophicum]|uniref:TM2 domain-containing protein n=1 Tax=Promethearchaeum syntrophicum TaxID=2594042 RepID=A0A5B9DDV9_9ARCH|nr:TM2 domain-containing protein [Candidatus Prometheoarchaeum syntrophicum]QEE17195.1 TM2 domain protein [Candidatus Prometheoarchaeum syntrophicum]